MAYGDIPQESPSLRGTAGSGVRYVEAGEADDGQRLDNFLLRQLKGVPRTLIYRLLRKGEVRVNSKRAKPDQRVKAGDRVRIPPVRQAESRPARPASQAVQERVTQAILYEDKDLVGLTRV